jgi:hypothetical protein
MTTVKILSTDCKTLEANVWKFAPLQIFKLYLYSMASLVGTGVAPCVKYINISEMKHMSIHAKWNFKIAYK